MRWAMRTVRTRVCHCRTCNDENGRLSYHGSALFGAQPSSNVDPCDSWILCMTSIDRYDSPQCWAVIVPEALGDSAALPPALLAVMRQPLREPV